jgi:long-chain fatty acid transport protein
MKTQFTIAAALMMTTTAASASGIDRNLTNYGILFEAGNYVELSYATVSPSVSGTYGDGIIGLTGSVGDTGNMSKDFNTLSGSVKYDLTNKLALGLFSNKPFGANAEYPSGLYTALAAEWDSRGTSIVLKYKVTPNISVYGGTRSIASQATIAIPDQLLRTGYKIKAGQLAAAAGAEGLDATTIATLSGQAAQRNAIATSSPAGTLDYTAETGSDRQTSYIVGAAYERPEIALRVALTYESGYTHTLETVENLPALSIIDRQSVTEISMPDVYTLDFQSGVAKDTLVFGSIRHATWSDWHVIPIGYEDATGGEVTGIETDTTTYRIGVGRKVTDALSGFARVTYEPGNGDVASRLAPTDGSTAFGFGGSYTNGTIKVTGGVEYITFGEATDAFGTEFAENDAVAVGLSVGYRF